MAKTLAQCQARVYSIVKVDPDKAAAGHYSRDNVTAALNTIQRFIAKSAVPAALGGLVQRTTHPLEPSSPSCFFKSGMGKGRVLMLAKDAAMTEEIEILSMKDWIALGKSEQFSSSNLRTYSAMEAGAVIYLRPVLTAPMTISEFYVLDPTDMSDSGNALSLPDDWFEWVCILSAEYLLMNAGESKQFEDVRKMEAGWSAQFRSQYGANPPRVAAPAPSGEVA